MKVTRSNRAREIADFSRRNVADLETREPKYLDEFRSDVRGIIAEAHGRPEETLASGDSKCVKLNVGAWRLIDKARRYSRQLGPLDAGGVKVTVDGIEGSVNCRVAGDVFEVELADGRTVQVPESRISRTL